MTAESMFVNTAGPASSCGSAVTTVRLRTATTIATESTSTSASRLPLAAAASTPDWRRASWPESNETPRLSSRAWAWAEKRIPSWPPRDSAKLGPSAGAVAAGRAAGRTPSTGDRPPARETGERRGSATLLHLLDVAGGDVLAVDLEQRTARAGLDGVDDAAVERSLIVEPRDGLADHRDRAGEVLPEPERGGLLVELVDALDVRELRELRQHLRGVRRLERVLVRHLRHQELQERALAHRATAVDALDVVARGLGAEDGAGTGDRTGHTWFPSSRCRGAVG